VQSSGERIVGAHYTIGLTAPHHRHSGVVGMRRHRQDIVRAVGPGLHHCVGVHKELSDLIEVFTKDGPGGRVEDSR